MSIVTKRGDLGQTDLAGNVRTSKASLRVESYGTIDELIAQLGFVRSISPGAAHGGLIKDIQRVLFRLASALATVPESSTTAPEIDRSLVDFLDEQIRELESSSSDPPDWTVAGAYPPAAAIDVARTVCRRAERHAVRLAETGESVDPNVIVYLNRLSDLLWLLGRQMESRAGVDGRLRNPEHPGKPWSPAW